MQRNGKLNSGSGEKNGNPWPPWRLPSACDASFQDPRTLLHSRYSHGLIFNLLYKAVYGESEPGDNSKKYWKECSEQILSLTVFLLELSLSFPQTDVAGKVIVFLYRFFPNCIFIVVSHRRDLKLGLELFID